MLRAISQLALGVTISLLASMAPATEPDNAPRLNPPPSVPDEYLVRWLTYEKAYELQKQLYDEPIGADDEEGPDGESDFARFKRHFSRRAPAFANPEYSWFGEHYDLRQNYSGPKQREIRSILQSYLVRLRHLASMPDAPSKLAWHALACTDNYQKLWPAWCSTRRAEPGLRRVSATVLWNTGDEDSIGIGFRYSPNKLAVEYDGKVRVLDLRNNTWSGIPAREGDDTGWSWTRYNITDDSFLGVHAKYSFATQKWVVGPPQKMPILNMEDPVEVGPEWVSRYINPPHGHIYPENESLPEPEKQRLIESFYDRFEFRSGNENPRIVHFSGSQIFSYAITAEGRIAATVGFEQHRLFRSADERSLELAETHQNLAFKEVMRGFFNGEWSAWNAEAPGEWLLLDQRFDYVSSVPMRAAIWEAKTKKWELLWDTKQPQMPGPPPGVLEGTIKQTPRWTLPREISHPPIGTLVNCTPTLSKNGSAFFLSESRDYISGDFAVHLWMFAPGSQEPTKVAIDLQGYRPSKRFSEQYSYDEPPLRIALVEKGFIVADSTRLWLVRWDFKLQTESKL
jgi:hypothetical protein